MPQDGKQNGVLIGPKDAATDEEKRLLVLGYLARAAAGETPQQIADSLGVHRNAINQLFLRYTEEEWREVQVARAWGHVERCLEDLADAQRTPEAVDVNRARACAVTAQWQLERLHRRLFGEQAQAVLGQGMVQINIDLGERKRAIEQSQDGQADGDQ